MTRVRLSDIVDGMDFQSDDISSYLHRPSGHMLSVSDEAFRAAEEDDEDAVEAEELAAALAISGRSSEYVALPDRFDIDEYSMMERFAVEIDDQFKREEAMASLRGSKAFRRFKDTVNRLELADDRYALRERLYQDLARSWCEANGIELDSRPADV